MESVENLDSALSAPSHVLNNQSYEATSEAEAISVDAESRKLHSPPEKRYKTAKDDTIVEEASSSTSPSSNCITIPLDPSVETAEATPTKSSPESRTAKATRSLDSISRISPSPEVASATSSTLRKFRKIPIFIVDYHMHVLEFLYRCFGTRHLPLENNILVHFDSHPDMVINHSIPASAAYDKNTMLERLSIENWIMPLCFTGQINRVVWMKNSWCAQIPASRYLFKIGQKDDRICVDCDLSYFISEGNYCAASEMEESREIELKVLNADTDDVQPDFISPADAHSFILDIDLDFFSTSNPFLEIYGEAKSYERLKEIFHYETIRNDSQRTCERRRQQLKHLQIIFEHLEETQSMENLPAAVSEVISDDTIQKIRELKAAVEEKYGNEDIEWMLMYDSGCTFDVNGLPHHVSTEAELEIYYRKLQEFLERLPLLPTVITIARSATDDYCPQFQVHEIQERVLEILQQVFHERVHDKPILQYMDEEWDIMNL